MARVVLVHGIAQQFEGPETLGLKLGAALRDGVQLGANLTLEPADVACAFYGNAFIEEGTRPADLPPWDEKYVEDGLEAELLDAWFQRAAELEPSIPPLDEEGTRSLKAAATSRALQVKWVRARLNGLVKADFFQGLGKRFLVSELKQVRRYLDDPPTWQAARASVAEQVGEDTRVIVAHSLGSVVAYEALCENPDWPVTDLVTVGSPLGLPLIFRRLSPLPTNGIGAWPAKVLRWTNVADPGDIVALINTLGPLFASGPNGPVQDRTITNGVKMHDFGRYLTAPTTGAAIAAGLRQASA